MLKAFSSCATSRHDTPHASEDVGIYLLGGIVELGLLLPV
jgi:hypothetical protein